MIDSSNWTGIKSYKPWCLISVNTDYFHFYIGHGWSCDYRLNIFMGFFKAAILRPGYFKYRYSLDFTFFPEWKYQ